MVEIEEIGVKPFPQNEATIRRREHSLLWPANRQNGQHILGMNFHVERGTISDCMFGQEIYGDLEHPAVSGRTRECWN